MNQDELDDMLGRFTVENHYEICKLLLNIGADPLAGVILLYNRSNVNWGGKWVLQTPIDYSFIHNHHKLYQMYYKKGN